MKKIVITLIVALFPGFAFSGSDVSKEIESVVKENMKYTEEENIEKSMSTFHSQSPLYLQTKSIIPKIFDNFKLKYELVSFKFIAVDNELAYARVKQRTIKLEGPAFKNNELDTV